MSNTIEDDLIFEILVKGKRKYEKAKLAIKTYDKNQETIANQQREIAELKWLMGEMLIEMLYDQQYYEDTKGSGRDVTKLWSENVMPECMVKAKELLSED